jgi:hypothetical protein
MGHMACTEPRCLYKGALYLTFLHYCTTSVHIYHVRYVVLTVVVLKLKVFWDITLF